MQVGESEVLVAKQFEEASRAYENNPVAYAQAVQHAVRVDKGEGNTIVMIPSESLNSMGFGNLGMTLAYLESTKNSAAK